MMNYEIMLLIMNKLIIHTPRGGGGYSIYSWAGAQEYPDPV